eukprot:3303695-Alexandrium_andersonii.AAC.1
MFSCTGCGCQAADTDFHWPAVAGTLPRCRSPPCWRARRLLRAAHVTPYTGRGWPGRGHRFPLAAAGIGHSCMLEA